MTFIDLCAAGLESPENIDDWIDRWHVDPNTADGAVLHDHLGMTRAEYALWVFSHDAGEAIWWIVQRRIAGVVLSRDEL